MVVVIYKAAGTHQIQKDYSHGNRLPCQKVYIHGCRASLKIAIYTAAVLRDRRFMYTAAVQYTSVIFHVQVLYTLLPCLQYKTDITAVVPRGQKQRS